MEGNHNDDNQKIILCEWIVKGEIALQFLPHFGAFGLKC
jgi:hypothetical protein